MQAEKLLKSFAANEDKAKQYVSAFSVTHDIDMLFRANEHLGRATAAAAILQDDHGIDAAKARCAILKSIIMNAEKRAK